MGRYKHFKGNEYLVAGIATKCIEPTSHSITFAHYSEDMDTLVTIYYDIENDNYYYSSSNDKIEGDLVLYLEPNKLLRKWVRPRSSFFSKVLLADTIIMDRFTKIG